MTYDVVIIGSGPAGYTAALYTSRAFLKTIIIAGPQVGGQLSTTTAVDNYPGFIQGIQGPELVQTMQKQAERFNAEVLVEEVKAIKKQESVKGKPSLFLVTTNKNVFETRAVIIATGASARRLGIPNEDKYKGKGVSYCATCDGFFFKGKEVVVVGGGDTAMEEATFLTRFATHVTVVHRRDQFRASPIMFERAQKDPKINFLINKVIVEIVGDGAVSGVKLKDTVTGVISEVKTRGIFGAIGHQPSTAFLHGLVELDPKGYVVLKKVSSALEPQTATSVSGIFAAGDCVDQRYRQAIVAAGMGCMAAMDVQKWLEDGDKR